jgi:hypothetical protein
MLTFQEVDAWPWNRMLPGYQQQLHRSLLTVENEDQESLVKAILSWG